MEKLAIIAGQGDLPEKIIASCLQKHTPHLIVCIRDQVPDNLKDRCDFIIDLGRVASTLELFKSNHVTHVVMAGAILKPSLKNLKLDFLGMKLLAKIGMSAGDDALLRVVASEFENAGIQVVAPHDIVNDFVVSDDCLTIRKPDDADWNDIKHGVFILNHLSSLDIGQSVIVQEGIVLGIEAIEGTDGLIERTSSYRHRVSDMKKNGGVLIKIPKQQQDERLDTPTVGLNTIQALHQANFSGLAIGKNQTILLDRDAVVNFANQHNLFIVSV